MTVNNIIPQARANRHGSTCPAWCTTGHEKINVHMSGVMTPAPLPWDARVRLVQDGVDALGRPRPPRVDVGKIAAGVQLEARDAQDLAKLLEELADCTPEEMRRLAGEVRRAAGIIEAAK